MDRFDEGPAKDGVDSDVFAKSNAQEDRCSVRKGVGEAVSDNGTKEAVFNSGRDFWRVRFGNCTSQTDGFKGVGWVVELNEVFNDGRVCGGNGFVEGVNTAVESGAGVE